MHMYQDRAFCHMIGTGNKHVKNGSEVAAGWFTALAIFAE